MSVTGIQGDLSPVEPIKGKKRSAPVQAAPAGVDKVQVSGEAKSLFEAGQSKRLQAIRKRLDDGYYMSPEVTEKVVNGLMDDLLPNG
jgi:hypothetical protein